MDPITGTFKIQTVGPMASGTSKKGNPWRTFDLQFEGDSTWYNCFWMPKEDPAVSQEITGTKSYDEEFKKYKFEAERANGGGKANWNPAAAQATVLHGAASVVGSFLAIPQHYELWVSENAEDSKKLKVLFNKYVTTVETVAKRLKDTVVGMGSMQPQQPVASTQGPRGDGDPGPTPPPNIETWPESGEEQIDI